MMKTPLALLLALALATLVSAEPSAKAVREKEFTTGRLKYGWTLEAEEDNRGGKWVFTRRVFDEQKMDMVAFAQSHIATTDLLTLRQLAEKAREWDTTCRAGAPADFEKPLPSYSTMHGTFRWSAGVSTTTIDSNDYMMACTWSREDCDAYIELADRPNLVAMIEEIQAKVAAAKKFSESLN